MKATILVILACTGVFAGAGVPATGLDAPPASESCDAEPIGVVIETDVQSSCACRILIRSNDRTLFDRGHVTTLSEAREVEGSFRFWTESSGRVLYVYDDVQNLVCRVTNPESVTLVDVLE